MKHLFLLVGLLTSLVSLSQNAIDFEKSPIYPGCESVSIEELKVCFNNKLNAHIYDSFKIPQEVLDDNYKGEVRLLFEVDKQGAITVLYIDAVYESLKEETKRIFNELPQVTPGTYNGKSTFFQYSLGIKIPLINPSEIQMNAVEDAAPISTVQSDDLNGDVSNEFDEVNKKLVPYEQLEYTSQLNIPFTHNYYARFDQDINGLGTNSHTAAKPFVFEEVAPYYDFKAEKKALIKGSDSWWSRKLWNEHLIAVQGKDYWFTIDPVFDLQLGTDTEADYSTTYNNTRGVYIQGGLGKKFSFSASVFESQGRFAKYFNDYAESIAAGNDEPIVPGRGLSKRFKDNGFDYPVAEGYISYSPAKFINIQFGHGRNFIGDGYRSLLQSDVTSPYPYLKLNTKFWKIKYTNTWMWLRDVRAEVQEDGAFLTKYMANHYLSWNVSKRLNIGLFESVLWTDDNNRGFDINYLNPVIFFRAIEFSTGQDAGNAILGASAKYKWNNKVNLYGQFILDEFSINDITGGNKSWKNKFGYQIGLKYFDAFKVDNLLLQFEYNRVRPYTYSHNTIVLNYAHNNQPMAHLWGANFSEAILIGRYTYKRWFGDAKIIVGKRGFDFNEGNDFANYGGNIFRSEVDRNADTGITVGQGNTATVFQADLQAGYIINPVSNLRIFANVAFRNIDPEAATASAFKTNTAWFNIGVRTDLFNWYNDF
ncbi:gliding motility protein RemB [Psychroserpens sp.]|uniref:gliding motility protein RemB n=1 Tax=Psychroserpens sp. TaxID=2020870 RepID=UPI001B2B5959|nr:gliding motility protein RemB [Psychroserpens sp.]MBO6607838.1 gliding motility protein RemB [Psychroserpens sp.]MBO6630555.1 gliding motility protein RemB [Psychroserpens sp.]MBO6654829.1 gliding motility protein RemB [Psychroserpens sp.]MBO6682747.1 gliding motility protein RemB [Psychroserpens sp.]MBO6751196.1 gliding motility protein RemB [Psychroserpens sp.]